MAAGEDTSMFRTAMLTMMVIVVALLCANLAVTVGVKGDVSDLSDDVDNMVTVDGHEVTEGYSSADQIAMSGEMGGAMQGNNICQDKKPYHASYDENGVGDGYFNNVDCLVDGVKQALEQSGTNVTPGYEGEIDSSSREPITEPYWKAGLCPVNVHWHLGAEHYMEGQYDEHGSSPMGDHDDHHRHLLEGDVREGFACHHYDSHDPIFTTEYEWQHCKGMVVGATYEVHWPHSAAGACGTPNQYQTPFYDGVFCNDGIVSLDPLNTYEKIGVQAQIFTVVNDEMFYYPDLIRGMIVDGSRGDDIAAYTGSTTGTTRDNEICSRYTPITWQVDRTCHLISASTFDKMCADMKAQRDDMSDDLHAHGARELVADEFAGNNMVDAEDHGK